MAKGIWLRSHAAGGARFDYRDESVPRRRFQCGKPVVSAIDLGRWGTPPDPVWPERRDPGDADLLATLSQTALRNGACFAFASARC